MKSDLIRHPCLICGARSRSVCGHTRADLRAHFARCLEIRRAACAAQEPEPRRRAHTVPAEGPEVFVPHDESTGHLVVVPVGGTHLKCRMPSDPPVRSLTDEDYAGQPDTPKESA